jgi:hypothetical protein
MLELLMLAGDYRTIVISPTLSSFHQKPSAPAFRGSTALSRQRHRARRHDHFTVRIHSDWPRSSNRR